jgi:hypothetical protein
LINLSRAAAKNTNIIFRAFISAYRFFVRAAGAVLSRTQHRVEEVTGIYGIVAQASGEIDVKSAAGCIFVFGPSDRCAALAPRPLLSHLSTIQVLARAQMMLYVVG